MTARALLLLALGAAGLAGLAALSLWQAQTVWPSYLAAWLVALTLPLGALLLVMAHDCLGRPETPLATVLRSFLPAMPLAAVMGAPMLLMRVPFYGLPDYRGNAFAAAWMAPTLCLARGLVVLAIWILLALLFRRPPTRPRIRLAALGLVLHPVLATLAAADWVGAADRNLAASSLGLILMAAQACAALALASLVVRRTGAAPHLPPGAAGLMVLFAAWVFLHFAQFLIVWSADLPGEAVWYLRRGDDVGRAGAAAAPVVLAIGLFGFWPRLGLRLVPLFEGLVFAMIVASMFWLIVPASRGDVSLQLADAAALLGLAGLVGGLIVLLWRPREPAHG